MDEAGQERFERLYRRHFRAVYRYALARVQPERAEDVAAETFLIAWRRLDQVPDDPAPWLFGVARKVIAGQLRAASRGAAVTEMLAARHAGARVPDPADQVERRESALAALSRLRESDREVLMLIAWDGLSPQAAARALGLSQPGFAIRLHRARLRLATALRAADAAVNLELAELATPATRAATARPPGIRERYPDAPSHRA